jgi:hypothetical protein
MKADATLIDEQRPSLPGTIALGRLSVRGGSTIFEGQSSGTDDLSAYQRVAAKSGLLVIGSTVATTARCRPLDHRFDGARVERSADPTLLRA